MKDNLEKYFNWNTWIEDIKMNENLPVLVRERAMKALIILRKHLGEDFLKYAVKTGHPLFSVLVNRAPWTRMWLAWLGECIRRLESYKGFTNVLKEFTDVRKHEHALLVLDFAFRFAKTGFEIVFEPKVERGKKADFMIVDVNTSEKLYVEASVLGPSKTEKEAEETMSAITNILFQSLMGRKLLYAGRIFKYLSPLHLRDIQQRIREALDTAVNEGISEISEPGAVELCIAREDYRKCIEDWCKRRKLKVGEIIGPPIDINEVFRLIRKIEREQEQLDKNFLNILLLDVPVFSLRLGDIRRAINVLEEYVYRYDHILFCVICSHYVGIPQGRSFVYKQHFFIERELDRGMVEELLILVNRYVKDIKVSSSTLAKTLQALVATM